MNTQIASTIRNQIIAIDPAAFFAWGTKNLIANSNGLQFKSSGMCRWKGWVDVKLNEATDLYDIDFFRIRNGVVKMDLSTKDVFVEDLVRMIDVQVG